MIRIRLAPETTDPLREFLS